MSSLPVANMPVPMPALPSKPIHSHMTALPPGFITVRIMQFIAVTVALALSAFEYTVYDYFTTVTVLIFATFTWVILLWMIVATYLTPKLYNYWAILAMEILMFIVWIPGFVFSLADAFNGDYSNNSCTTSYNRATGRYTTTCYALSPAQNVYATVVYVTCAMCGVLMILALVSMIVVSVFIARHRNMGGHNVIGSQFTDPIMRPEEGRLQAQNLNLQQQVLALQQKQFEMERHLGVINPAATPMQQVHSPVSSMVVSPEMSQRDVEAQHPQQGDTIEPAPRPVYA